MKKVYFDNVIVSGEVRSDLEPMTELEALRGLRVCERQGLIEIVTSRESWREQERTNNPATRQALLQAQPDVPVVPYDHELFGSSYLPDRYWGFISNPSYTDVIDPALLDDLRAIGLKHSDAHHLMYAARNDCARFVTLDLDFLDHRQSLEARCGGLVIVRPSELLAELGSAMGS